jgi:hypothetical protein
MLTAIRATYRQGQLIWHETPPADVDAEVVVTFLEQKDETTRKPRKAGSLKGRGSLPADFNEPLDDLSDYM